MNITKHIPPRSIQKVLKGRPMRHYQRIVPRVNSKQQHKQQQMQVATKRAGQGPRSKP